MKYIKKKISQITKKRPLRQWGLATRLKHTRIKGDQKKKQPMKNFIFVKVKSAAKEEKIEKIDKRNFRISVKEPPVEGRANQAVIKALAKYLGIATSNIKIISGLTSPTLCSVGKPTLRLKTSLLS